MKPVDAARMAEAKEDEACPALSSQAVIASMRQHDIAVTAENFAVWQCYLTGANEAVRRALDIMLSNGMKVEDRTLRALHARHLRLSGQARALQDLARVTLKRLARASAEPDLADGGLLTDLGADLREIVRRSEDLTLALNQSEARVAQLEACLHEARQDSLTDGLTGLANRRAFDAALRAHAGDAMNDGTDLACLLIDIDRFKAVNDRLGHLVGDSVLRQVAATLDGIVRKRDVLARYGGEEFAVILPDTDRAGALAVAEKLRAATEQQRQPLAEAGTLRVTISVGVACYDHGESLTAWLARADGALYAAKSAGRNRVVFGEAALRGGNVVALAARERA